MSTESPQRCVRCHFVYTGEPHLMAGRTFCCSSCAVGSACEHQGIHRATNVRRYGPTFDRFRQVVKSATPYETEQRVS